MLVSTSCGCSSEMNKSSSPPPSSSLTNLGYSKISLPPLRNSPAFLRRCVSDLSSPPPPPHHPNPFADRKAVSLPQSPERKVSSAFNSSLLPPLPPPPHLLSRTNSDLSPSPAKTFSRSSSSNDMSLEFDDTPNSKKLKRMRGCIKEVIDWCNNYVLEEDLKQEDGQLDGGVTQDVPDIDAPQDVPDIDTTQDLQDDTCIEDSCEREFSESLSVEKKDDSLVIHFRCHCNKGYQFLLNGGDCYYKLM